MGRVLSSYGDAEHSVSLVRQGGQYVVIDLCEGEPEAEAHSNLGDAKVSYENLCAAIDEEAEENPDEDDDGTK